MLRLRAFLSVLCVCLLLPAAASAQGWWSELDDGYLPKPSIATSLPGRGDPGGARKWLGERGVAIGLEYTADLIANVDGGTRTGTIYQGKLNAILSIDFGKLVGLDGLSLGANVFQLHNTGRMRRDLVGGVNTIAAIEAVPATRLSELWLEQAFFGGKASLRVGQLTADSEFFYSDLSLMFLQSDWPTIAALNLPSGGAAYPLSTPGVRLMVRPAPELTVLMALLNGDPAGPGPGDEQVRNPHGLNFRLSDAPFLIVETQLQRNQKPTDRGLATTLKLGGWYHFGTFDDRRVTGDGLSIADPAGSGEAAKRQGNFGLYAVIDQQLWRPEGGDAQSGVSVFGRVSASPADRNAIGFHIDGGVVFAGLIAGRPDDRFGAGIVHARYSSSITGFDRDQAFFDGAPRTVRDHETNLELTYVAQIVPGWTIQPTFQYVWHPSGDWTRNAVVVGARSLWRY